jgi:hypothetical protein
MFNFLVPVSLLEWFKPRTVVTPYNSMLEKHLQKLIAVAVLSKMNTAYALVSHYIVKFPTTPPN